MKKALIVGLVIGIVLGTLQIFLVRTTVTDYGYKMECNDTPGDSAEMCMPEPCLGKQVGDVCYTEGKIQRYRGFPLTSKSGGNANSVSLGLALYANMAIFILGVPALVWILTRPFRRKSKQKSSPEKIDTPTIESDDDV